ncbi:MerR family transcriptional regulator [Streptomyces sp. MB22_4]|uniref:MerR family transcriptional regulator n=1 Tax=Streptomyces sp. MB22_4 TaxID=3383120 RepID=UPI0039A0199C
MRIGELARLTESTPRLLRYYEKQGLITPRREANGYRDYDDYLVDRVLQIRGLLDAGLPTRVIKQILPCLDAPRTIHFADATPEMLDTLECETERMTRRIQCLTRNRDAIMDYLSVVRELACPPAGTGSTPPA